MAARERYLILFGNDSFPSVPEIFKAFPNPLRKSDTSE
jgi:hypothetical protein